MKQEILEEVFLERIKDNKEIFNSKESDVIKKNISLYSKVYLLGILDSKM